MNRIYEGKQQELEPVEQREEEGEKEKGGIEGGIERERGRNLK